MSTPTVSAAPHPTVSPDVLAFAREQGVEQYVPAVIELTRRLYPTATRFDVFLEDDPEIANDRHIILELDVRTAWMSRSPCNRHGKRIGSGTRGSLRSSRPRSCACSAAAPT
jgi:hypothetical protein